VSFFDRIRQAGQQAATRAKEELDVIQRKREVSQAYGQLGRRAAELAKEGQLTDPEAVSIVERIGRLEAELASAERSEGEASAGS
jgi:hypothetical protein